MKFLPIDAYRPLPFYFINRIEPGDLTRESIRQSMNDLKTAGFGGCILFNKPPFGFDRDGFLSDRWFETIRLYVEEARRIELRTWLNDGYDFPPGDAAGRIEKHSPHLKQRRLRLNAAGDVEIVEVPWFFPAFEEPESSRLFIELVYETHQKHLGEFFGNGITGFFSDADNRRMPHGVLSETYYPWSLCFSEAFEKHFGYNVEPHLRNILKAVPSQAAADYWLLAGRLYQQWFANNYRWCHQHHLQYAFHTSDSGPYTPEEVIRSSIFNEGDAFELHAHSDFPGTDHELRTLYSATPFKPASLWFQESALWGQVKECRSPAFSSTHGDVRAKLASSAAFLHRRKGALCEPFAATNWSAQTDDWRRIILWQVMQGINFLIPHAVHHRMGPTQYFAPPEFMRCGNRKESIRLLNDHMAWLCAVASQGELIAPIALLDPTREIWRERKPFPLFFDLCDQLNRMPYGFVIAPERAILDNTHEFRIAINPGMALSDEYRKRVEHAGVILLEAHQLDQIQSILNYADGYSGTGRPHFMRRKLQTGEALLVANIEDQAGIHGEVRYQGHAYQVSLLPGEVAVFTPEEIIRPTPRTVRAKKTLETHADISWHAPNSITLVRWEDADGRLLDKQAVATSGMPLFFRWRNAEAFEDLILLVPHGLKAAVLDGQPLTGFESEKLFDETYHRVLLTGSGATGSHTLELRFERYEEAVYSSWFKPCYLKGHFSCSVENLSEDAPVIQAISYFNFSLHLPQSVRITLQKENHRLSMKQPWTLQGRPFYSGKATYRFSFQIPEDFKKTILHFPEVYAQAELKVNGMAIGVKAFPPYDFDLKTFRGFCEAELTVENTLGNQLDAYAPPSGLAAAPELLDLMES